MRRLPTALCGVVLAACSIVDSARAQGPTLGFVSKLGQDMDVRSGGRVLADDILAGNVILPELADNRSLEFRRFPRSSSAVEMCR